MSKHSSAPWKTDDYFHGTIWDNTGNQVAELFYSFQEDHFVGNRDLIAAAPELLEALTNLRQYCIAYGSDKDMAPWIEQADAAIRKAEGGAQ